ncbi:MAG: CBS domain-containing protein, partial [Calditrichaeota bacterium]|nr:CBS domain-containing protein [Calditrichota bacterium]
MKETLVKTLMTEDVTCLPPDAPLQLAVKKMVEQRYSCIVIIKNEIPFGIITERDIVNMLNHGAGETSLSLPVSEFMSSPILSLNENETLFDATVISRAEKIRHIPVVDNEENLVGLVTYSDLVDAHFHAVEIQSELLEQSFEARIEKLQQ